MNANRRAISATQGLALLLTLAACATNPVTGQRQLSLMSEQQEIALGRQLHEQVRQEMGFYDDPRLQQYVASVGSRLAAMSHRPNLPWHFTIVDVPAVNAFALPGGYIYITRGILPYLNDEAELAGVLGHEMGHVTARHAAQQVTRSELGEIGLVLGSIFAPATRPFTGLAETGLNVLFLKYSRENELQADRLGVQYESKAGWDPHAVPEFLMTLERIDQASDQHGVPNWLSTHPATGNRVQLAAQAVNQLSDSGRGGKYATDRSQYLQAINGVMFGDNPHEGIVRGSLFLHPDLRFELRFPQGWDVENTKTAVVAKAPNRGLYVVLQLAQRGSGRNVGEYARTSMRAAGFRELQGEATKINGLDAHVGIYTGQLEGLGQVLAEGAHVALDGRIYMIAGIAPRQAFDGVRQQFRTTIESFRGMSYADAANVRPNRVELYTARPGDTWQTLARRGSEEIVRPRTLAIMNGHDPNDSPRAGERLKIVVIG